MSRRVAVALLVGSSLILSVAAGPTHAATLIGNPFTSTISGWTDAFPPPTRLGDWRLSLHNPTLMDTNNANPPTAGATVNDGTYQPDVLYQNNFSAPGTYDLSATMRTNDDDIIGLVWNYQDPNNYFRVGIRTQAAGTFGGTQGLAVQKIVGGVLTQISPNGTGPGAATPITQAMINNRTAFDLKVSVSGTNYAVLFNGMQIVSGTDSDLASGRKVGISSWAQLSDTDETPDPPFWGTEVETLTVSDSSGSLYSQNFSARPISWRQLIMTNAAGTSTNGAAINRDSLGNFGRSINDPWIYQASNGFQNATTNNTDFIGPGVVVNEVGATSMTDYEMKIRIGANDNDGVGVLVRVQDDNNYYRINFTNEVIGTGVTRAPRGLSVQKVLNGVWSELYRDNQTTPLFVYSTGNSATYLPTPATGLAMFDLKVVAQGNTLLVQVDNLQGQVITYPLITDSTNPLLSGSVGLATWGTQNVFYTNHGGVAGAPLVVEVPEPSMVCLALLAAVGICALNRRRPV